ncbi:DUF2630 family protein [Arthrobacter sp. JZ12]|uniref:DUF2630 family protein n=1 Tax=Arthrobacter sp. JZ12 TaxID=2654190 RepID=UPI002B48373E|nr:DUF2630 family protein [Arthrobacter sp. JZ12]WRH23704.1 DUF2630 family protein [Arthrobacter sp. JZ12]
MNDQDILARIQSLVEEEHELRGSSSDDPAGSSNEDRQNRLRRVEEELDQCWDLLRQRRAKHDAGESPQDAEPRPIDQVEGYRQ